MVRVLDLFCGAGGSSAGARLAGARIVGAVDKCPIATATFRANFADVIVETRELGIDSRLPRGVRRGDVDLVLASPECTNHSPAKGARARCEESRRTSHYVLGFAEKLRPRWIVIENVVQLRNWQGYETLTCGLSELGYHTRPVVLDAADFGVPQSRRRLFLLCDRECMPPSIDRRSNRARKAIDIVRFDGPWWSTPLYAERRARGTIERAERAIAALGPGVPFLVVYYGSDGAGGWQSLDRPIRTLTTLDRFGLVTWDGSTPMLRMLQVPELMGAMGFPPRFKMDEGSRRDRIRLVGNAVAPPVMKAVVERLCRERTRAGFMDAATEMGHLGAQGADDGHRKDWSRILTGTRGC